VKKIVESDGGDYETFVVGLCVARGSFKECLAFLGRKSKLSSQSGSLGTYDITRRPLSRHKATSALPSASPRDYFYQKIIVSNPHNEQSINQHEVHHSPPPDRIPHGLGLRCHRQQAGHCQLPQGYSRLCYRARNECYQGSCK
jgi:hypothetical protein